MKRKIALMMSSVLLCAAIFGGCATYALGYNLRGFSYKQKQIYK